MIRFVDPDVVPLTTLVERLRTPGGPDVVVGGRSKRRALDRFAAALGFPEWAGRNLDALYELLDERAHRETASGADWVLVWSPSPRLIADHPGDYARIVAVLADVVSAQPGAAEAAAGSDLEWGEHRTSDLGHRVGRGARRVVVHGADPAALRPPWSQDD